MRILETEGRSAIAARCGEYRKLLLEVYVRALQEFLFIGVDEVKAVLAVSFNVKTRGVTVAILVLPTGERQARRVETIAYSG